MNAITVILFYVDRLFNRDCTNSKCLPSTWANYTFEYCKCIFLCVEPWAAPFMHFFSLAVRRIHSAIFLFDISLVFTRMLVNKEINGIVFRFVPTSFSSEPSSLQCSVQCPPLSPHLPHSGSNTRKQNIRIKLSQQKCCQQKVESKC